MSDQTAVTADRVPTEAQLLAALIMGAPHDPEGPSLWARLLVQEGRVGATAAWSAACELVQASSNVTIGRQDLNDALDAADQAIGAARTTIARLAKVDPVLQDDSDAPDMEHFLADAQRLVRASCRIAYPLLEAPTTGNPE